MIGVSLPFCVYKAWGHVLDLIELRFKAQNEWAVHLDDSFRPRRGHGGIFDYQI